MIHYYDIGVLSCTWRDMVGDGRMSVYDVTVKHVVRGLRHKIYHDKWLGYSVVVRVGGKNKILVYGG